jgi:hypothetical protein
MKTLTGSVPATHFRLHNNSRFQLPQMIAPLWYQRPSTTTRGRSGRRCDGVWISALCICIPPSNKSLSNSGMKAVLSPPYALLSASGTEL